MKVIIHQTWEKYMKKLKSVLFQKLFWPFTVWINHFTDLKKISNSWPSTLNFKSFSQSQEQFLLPVGQNNYANKIPILIRLFLTTLFLFDCFYNKLIISRVELIRDFLLILTPKNIINYQMTTKYVTIIVLT